MKKLWEPNENYDEFKPPLWGNMPYKRLYNELTSIELEELIHDAMENEKDERPRNAVYSAMFLVKQIANDLDALQGKSPAAHIGEEETT